MKITKMLIAVAILLSSVSAYCSVAGLIAIFPAAFWTIVVLGGTLEIAKLIVIIWLHTHWKECPFLLKTYFTTAVAILMLITTMGTFGALSKAHLDQGVPTGDIIAQVSLIDEKITIEKEKLNGIRKELSQLDTQVDAAVSRTTTAGGNERSIQIRRGQQKERDRIAFDISKTQTKIASLTEERVPLAGRVREIEAEVGPIKYIAALIYGDTQQDQNLLESAVRIVILLIVVVFDPLAVLMLVAANWQMRQNSIKQNQVPFFNKTNDEPEEHKLSEASIEEQITTIIHEEPVDDAVVVKSPPEISSRILR